MHVGVCYRDSCFFNMSPHLRAHELDLPLRQTTVTDMLALLDDPAVDIRTIGERIATEPVLAARLISSTKFDVNNKAVQVNLNSTNAAGQPVFARYNISLGDTAKAADFGGIANGLVPAA